VEAVSGAWSVVHEGNAAPAANIATTERALRTWAPTHFWTRNNIRGSSYQKLIALTAALAGVGVRRGRWVNLSPALPLAERLARGRLRLVNQ
jgi:hypothetical protein